jgi:hypothetical protein
MEKDSRFVTLPAYQVELGPSAAKVLWWSPVQEATVNRKRRKTLKLTPEEAESIGVELPAEPELLPEDLREHPLHEQVTGELTEEDVAEALTGEVTPESVEDVDEAVADDQEDAEPA